jgi:hypothetical protein
MLIKAFAKIATPRSGGIQAGGIAAAAAGGSEMAKSNSDGGPMGYFVDSLFRKDINLAVTESLPARNGSMLGDPQEPTAAESASEVTRIFMNTISTGPLPEEDIRYVGQMVTQRTGLTQLDAEKRVIDTYTRVQTKLRDAETVARNAADKGRKASAYAALWLFISLLIGAFVASFAATYGGQQRDL